MDREYVSQHYSLSKHKPKTFPKGKADSGAELIKGIAYSSLGWLIPCCWVDPRLKKDFVDDGNIITDRKYDIRKYPKYADLFTEELKLKNVEKVEDILSVGDSVKVKLIKIDDQGRLDFSRKALLEKPEGWQDRKFKNDRSFKKGNSRSFRNKNK